jgi:hypothetical protein
MMNRLKIYFSKLDRNDTTYEMIYTGAYAYTKEGIVYGDPKIGNAIFDSVYKDRNVEYEIARSHRLTPDKPCVTVKLPVADFFERNEDLSEDEKIIFADYALRKINLLIKAFNEENFNRKRTDKESGMIYSYFPGNEVLKRNASYVSKIDGKYYVHFVLLVQLPRLNHKKAMNIMCKVLPSIINTFTDNFDIYELQKSIELFLLQQKIRNWLETSPYNAFIANHSILPRDTNGMDPKHGALPFESPKAYEMELFGYKGMVIPKGISVITGGGYSGKSTLLDAISAGINNHILGDGRELCITNPNTLKIMAEDGRSVSNVDISPFIKWIPGSDPKDFSTTHASGSISQAANVMEAIEMGASLFLIDEDRTAANFMYKDPYMREILTSDPIIPFSDQINNLYHKVGISCILVIGSNSEYLLKAEHVFLMDEYKISDINQKISNMKKNDNIVINEEICLPKQKHLLSNSISTYPQDSGTEKIDLQFGFLFFGDEMIDVRMFSHLSKAQILAIAFIIREIIKSNMSETIDLQSAINKVFSEINDKGMDTIYSNFFYVDRWIELPRKIDILSVIYRMKNIKLK